MLSFLRNSAVRSGVSIRFLRMETQSKDPVLAVGTVSSNRSSLCAGRKGASQNSLCLLLITAFCFGACHSSHAQTALSQVLGTTTTANTASAPTDPLGRTTPSGCVLGFLQAAQKGDNSIAAEYLQMNAAHRQAQGERLAADLKFVMDRAFNGRVGTFTLPEGTPQEGVAPGHQKLGTMSSGDVEVDLDLVRVSDPNAGKIWLISADTLARVPELYDQVEARQVESKLPSVLVKHQLAGMPIWQWLALLLALPVAAALGWLLLAILGVPLRWWARRRRKMDVANWRSMSSPAWLLAGTLAHQTFARYVGMPLLDRHYYFEITSVALIISATWIGWRVARWSLRRVRNRALAYGHVGTGSLMLLGERIIKAVIFLAGIFAVLSSLGFNLNTVLAGVGIGGLAIGFGAQKTIENLFGGVSVLGDEAFRVGDYCRFGDRTGTVEDIGLRSTWIRTDDRTVVAIPNGTVATINVENFSRRDKILFKTSLGIRRETGADQLRWLLAEIRRLIYSHPKVEAKGSHVRLTDIAGTSLNVEVWAYVLTRDADEFLAIREDLLLRIMQIVEQSGSGLALPSQTLYLGRDRGLDQAKTDAAVQKVAELRDEKQLPFPDFDQEDISSFKAAIEYPPTESAVRNKREKRDRDS